MQSWLHRPWLARAAAGIGAAEAFCPRCWAALPCARSLPHFYLVPHFAVPTRTFRCAAFVVDPFLFCHPEWCVVGGVRKSYPPRGEQRTLVMTLILFFYRRFFFFFCRPREVIPLQCGRGLKLFSPKKGIPCRLNPSREELPVSLKIDEEHVCFRTSE